MPDEKIERGKQVARDTLERILELGGEAEVHGALSGLSMFLTHLLQKDRDNKITPSLQSAATSKGPLGLPPLPQQGGTYI